MPRRKKFNIEPDFNKILSKILDDDVKKDILDKNFKPKKLENNFDDETKQELLDQSHQIIHLEVNLVKKKEEIKVLKKKIIELEKENQELKDSYSRFDILDFGGKK